MIFTIFVHHMPEPLARECCTLDEAKLILSNFGSHRIEKIIITDFRPIIKKLPDGTEKEICPDF